MARRKIGNPASEKVRPRRSCKTLTPPTKLLPVVPLASHWVANTFSTELAHTSTF